MSARRIGRAPVTRPGPLRRPARAGFTLLEIMAVLLILAMVLTAAIDFYLDLSRAGNAAVDSTREARRAALLLDRVARDLAAAALVRKPADEDPLAHPWLFLAEGDGDAGAQRLKFVTRGHRPRSDQAAESDLEMVAWMVRDAGFEGRTLLRWSVPQLPESLDRRFPRPEDPGVQVVAEGLEQFGVRLLGDDGAWHDRWDSSQLLDSSELPLAAEVSVAFAPEDGDDGGVREPRVWQRRVLIPSRPLDLEALLNPEAAGEAGDSSREETGEDEDTRACVTVGECLSRNPSLFEGIEPQVIDSVRDRCVEDVGVPEAACQ